MFMDTKFAYKSYFHILDKTYNVVTMHYILTVNTNKNVIAFNFEISFINKINFY
jgi:hypothetical protein